MNIGYIFVVTVVILVSMTLHEAMHGMVAYWLGDHTAKLQGRLSFNPLVHIDPSLTLFLPVILALTGLPIFGGAKPVPFNPYALKFKEWGSALVAIAGPLTNLLLAFVSYGLFAVVHSSGDSFVSSVFATSAIVNLGFFAFNILPFPPLDGSRVAYALAPDFMRRAMERVEQYGLFLVFAIVLIASPILSDVIMFISHFFLNVFSKVFVGI